MANKHFDNTWGIASEQNLVDELVTEMIEIAGREWFYISRETNNIDNVLNECATASYGKFRVMTGWVENYTDFGANNIALSTFGISSNNTMTLVVSKSKFKDDVAEKPLAGDLIYDPMSKLLFEIKYPDAEATPSFQLQALYVYTLKCELFTYSHEDFTTNIPSLDNDLNPATFIDNFDKSHEVVEETREEEYLDVSEGNPFGTIFDNEET